jgi:hypothetical protein
MSRDGVLRMMAAVLPQFNKLEHLGEVIPTASFSIS